MGKRQNFDQSNRIQTVETSQSAASVTLNPLLYLGYETFALSARGDSLSLKYKVKKVALFENQSKKTLLLPKDIGSEFKAVLEKAKGFFVDVQGNGILLDKITQKPMSESCYGYALDQHSGQFFIISSLEIDPFLDANFLNWSILAAGELCTDELGRLRTFNNKSLYSQSDVAIRNFFDFLHSRGLARTEDFELVDGSRFDLGNPFDSAIGIGIPARALLNPRAESLPKESSPGTPPFPRLEGDSDSEGSVGPRSPVTASVPRVELNKIQDSVNSTIEFDLQGLGVDPQVIKAEFTNRALENLEKGLSKKGSDEQSRLLSIIEKGQEVPLEHNEGDIIFSSSIKIKGQKKLGKGGSGVVRAVNYQTSVEGIPVTLHLALKVIDVHDPNVLEAVKREIAIQNELASYGVPVAKLLSAEIVDGQAYLLMPQYRALSEYRPADFRNAVDYTIQVIDALKIAHAHGIVHRDIKPQNLFIDASGKILLGDFGAAVRLDEYDEVVVGTDYYVDFQAMTIALNAAEAKRAAAAGSVEAMKEKEVIIASALKSADLSGSLITLLHSFFGDVWIRDSVIDTTQFLAIREDFTVRRVWYNPNFYNALKAKMKTTLGDEIPPFWDNLIELLRRANNPEIQQRPDVDRILNDLKDVVTQWRAFAS